MCGFPDSPHLWGICHAMAKKSPTQPKETLKIPNNKHQKSYRSHKHYENWGYGLVWDRQEIAPIQAVETGQLAIMRYKGELDLSSLTSRSRPTFCNSGFLTCHHSHRNSLTLPHNASDRAATAPSRPSRARCGALALRAGKNMGGFLSRWDTEVIC